MARPLEKKVVIVVVVAASKLTVLVRSTVLE